MKNSTSSVVRIAEPEGQSNLSKGQKLFNKLVKKIADQRGKLHVLQTAIADFEQKHASDIIPLIDDYNQHRISMLRLFDAAYAGKALSRREKSKLSLVILNLAEDLLMEDDSNEEVKAIFNMHSAYDFDEQAEAEAQMAKDQVKQEFGIDVGDDVDMNSKEDILRMLAEHMKKEMEREQEQEQERAENRSQNQEAQQNTRKKSAKQLAKEASQKEQEQNLSQSIREVFRKLASALHPDKEQDPAERDRKTGLMQMVNVAYAANDLLKLLELQLEVEQIDQSMINSLSEDRLKHYNQILSGQSFELQHQLDAVIFGFKMRNNVPPYDTVTPASLTAMLRRDVKELQSCIKGVKEDLRDFTDIKELKNFIKYYQPPPDRGFDFEEDGGFF